MSNKIKEINKKMRSLQQSVDQISSLAKETKSMTYAVHDEVCYIDELCVAIRDLNTQIERLTDKVDLMYEAGKYTYPPSPDEITEEMLRIVYNDPIFNSDSISTHYFDIMNKTICICTQK